MGIVIRWLLTVSLAIATGVGSALYLAGWLPLNPPGLFRAIELNHWTSDPAIGSTPTRGPSWPAVVCWACAARKRPIIYAPLTMRDKRYGITVPMSSRARFRMRAGGRSPCMPTTTILPGTKMGLIRSI